MQVHAEHDNIPATAKPRQPWTGSGLSPDAVNVHWHLLEPGEHVDG